MFSSDDESRVNSKYKRLVDDLPQTNDVETNEQSTKRPDVQRTMDVDPKDAKGRIASYNEDVTGSDGESERHYRTLTTP